MKPKTMVMHQDLDRLFVSMKQGVIFIFDISDITPIMLHTIEFPYYASRMNIDTTVNTLQSLTTKGSLICLQLSQKNAKLHEPTSFIESKDQESEKICSFQWLSRGQRNNSNNGTYVEGSLKGKIWIRDIYMENDQMIKIPTDFTDKIKTIHFDQEKNILFASSRDGKFRCWKLPVQWGTKQMEELDNEFDFINKQAIR